MNKKGKNYCPFTRKKCIKEKCRCWNKELFCCDFFDAVGSIYKIDEMFDMLNKIF